MHWYKVEPGVLDRACRDFDVLDDASIQRGEVRDGRLHIGEERYGAIVLPGCSVLEDDTAARLVAFVERGGTLVAVGRIPRMIVGTTGGERNGYNSSRHCSSLDKLTSSTLRKRSYRCSSAVPALIEASCTHARQTHRSGNSRVCACNLPTGHTYARGTGTESRGRHGRLAQR